MTDILKGVCIQENETYERNTTCESNEHQAEGRGIQFSPQTTRNFDRPCSSPGCVDLKFDISDRLLSKSAGYIPDSKHASNLSRSKLGQARAVAG
jgi:hypothetical protein